MYLDEVYSRKFYLSNFNDIHILLSGCFCRMYYSALLKLFITGKYTEVQRSIDVKNKNCFREDVSKSIKCKDIDKGKN